MNLYDSPFIKGIKFYDRNLKNIYVPFNNRNLFFGIFKK